MTDVSEASQGESGGVASAPEEAAAEAIAAFALSLYTKLAAGDSNLFFAPASIFAGLVMTWLGAQGETDAELERALFLPDDPERLRAILSALSQATAEASGSELEIANALWVQEGYALLPEYLDVLKHHLGAGVSPADFSQATDEAREAINAWAAERTKCTIRDLIEPGVLTALTRLVLVSAAHFKGLWATWFDRTFTREQRFYRLGKSPVKVPFMHQRFIGRVIGEMDLQALELPYAGGALSMVVILPREVEGLRVLERQLSPARLRRILDRLAGVEPRDVAVYLPKFRIESAFRIDQALKDLGVWHAFDADSADFSGVSADPEGLCLAAVVQKTSLTVDEDGAAAAPPSTAISAVRGVTPEFCAANPFVFLIRDTRSGSIVFFGRVADPTV